MLARSYAVLAGAALLLAPPHGTVRVERFFAPALGVEKHYVIYLPPSYGTAPARRYPVAYYLHGLTGNEADWVSLASIDVVADSLTAGGGAEMILVMPDGDDGWYTNWEEAPEPYAACLAGPGTRTTSRAISSATSIRATAHSPTAGIAASRA